MLNLCFFSSTPTDSHISGNLDFFSFLQLLVEHPFRQLFVATSEDKGRWIWQCCPLTEMWPCLRISILYLLSSVYVILHKCSLEVVERVDQSSEMSLSVQLFLEPCPWMEEQWWKYILILLHPIRNHICAMPINIGRIGKSYSTKSTCQPIGSVGIVTASSWAGVDHVLHPAGDVLLHLEGHGQGLPHPGPRVRLLLRLDGSRAKEVVVCCSPAMLI